MIEVKLIGHYGTDEDISRQAGLSSGRAEAVDISKRIRYLLEHKHLMPFEVPHFHFEMKLPIAIDRQIMTYRHKDGPISNSGRYGSVQGEIFQPEEMCELDSGDVEDWENICRDVQGYYASMVEKYKPIFGGNRAREIFRNLLPQGQMTNRSFLMNLRSLIHFLEERLADHAQAEVREVARKMLVAICEQNLCPITFKALADLLLVNDQFSEIVLQCRKEGASES